MSLLSASQLATYTAKIKSYKLDSRSRMELALLGHIEAQAAEISRLRADAVTDRARISTLEDEKSANLETIAALRSELASLIAENAALLAKLEALSSLPEPTPPAHGPNRIEPASVSVESGEVVQFRHLAWPSTGGDVEQEYPATWSASSGSIDQNGRFVAGDTNATITATSTIHDFRIAEAQVLIFQTPSAGDPIGGGGGGNPFTADGWNNPPDDEEVWDYATSAEADASSKLVHNWTGGGYAYAPDVHTPFFHLVPGGFFGENAVEFRFNPDDHGTSDSGIIRHFRLNNYLIGPVINAREVWAETYEWYSENWTTNGPAVGGFSYKAALIFSVAGVGARYEQIDDPMSMMTLSPEIGEEVWTEPPQYTGLDKTQPRRLRIRLRLPLTDDSDDCEAEYWVTERDGTTTHHRSRVDLAVAGTGIGVTEGNNVYLFQFSGANKNKGVSEIMSAYRGPVRIWYSDPTVP